MDAPAATDMEYKPPPQFEEIDKDPLIEFNLTDSNELWLVQWPVNQDPDFDGKEVTLKLNAEGNLGSFEGLSGKSYEVVSFKSQEEDTTVFLPSASKSKIVGKISRRISFVHYPEPSEFRKDDSLNVKQMAERAATSLTNSATRFTTPSQRMKSRSLQAVSGYTSSMYTSKDKSLMSGPSKGSKLSKRRQGDDPTRSLDQALQDSGRGHSGITTGSEDSHQTKSKKPKKSRD